MKQHHAITKERKVVKKATGKMRKATKFSMPAASVSPGLHFKITKDKTKVKGHTTKKPLKKTKKVSAKKALRAAKKHEKTVKKALSKEVKTDKTAVDKLKKVVSTAKAPVAKKKSGAAKL